MKRRDFIRNMMIMGMGLALAPEVIAKQVAEAAWQDGGNVLPGVAIRQTHLSFRSLTNRRVTDAIIVPYLIEGRSERKRNFEQHQYCCDCR